MICLSYYCLCSLFKKIRYKKVEHVLPSSGGRGRGREVAQTMYTHVSKSKNKKIEERKKKRR
jgi:hypothetical protein